MEVPRWASQEMATRIPVFTVLKKGVIIKNIFLDTPILDSATQHNVDECKFLMGRNPDCQIVLDHPSISRFHLEVLVHLPQRLVVTDLSSVHGTCVSGKKIEPRVPVELAEGDLLKLGASTRAYVLRWVRLSDVLELENSLVSLPQETEDSHQVDGHLTLVDNCDGLWEMTIPSAPPMLEWTNSSSANGCSGAVSAGDYQITDRKESEELSFFTCSSPMLDGGEEKSTKTFSSAQMLLPAEGEESSPLRSRKQVMSSGLLSRRSKSVCLLRVHTGRSRERIEDENSDAKLEMGNKIVDVDARNGEESICKVLFPGIMNASDFVEEVDEDETFVSDKENMTPEVPPSQKSGRVLNYSHRSPLCSVTNLRESKEGLYHWDKENQEESSADFVGRKGEKTFCKVLFPGSDDVNANEEEREAAFVADKENKTPVASQSQKLNMVQKVFQKSPLCAVTNSTGKEQEVSRRSKSVCLLRVHTGRSRERIEDENSDAKLEMGNKIVDVDARNGEESICKVLFPGIVNASDFVEEVDEDETFVSDKENTTPEVPPSQKSRRVLNYLHRSPLCSVTNLRESKEGLYHWDKENQEESSADFVGRKGEKTFCKVLFPGSDEVNANEEEREAAFVADEENKTPVAPQSQKLKMVQKVFQKSPLCAVTNSTGKEQEVYHLDKDQEQENIAEFIARKEELLWKFLLPGKEVFNGVGEEEQEEDKSFFSDKENLTPGVSRSLCTKFQKAESKLWKSFLNDLNEVDAQELSWSADMSSVSELQKSSSKLNLDADEVPQDIAERKSFSDDNRIADGNEVGLTSDKENQTPQFSSDQRTNDSMSDNRWRIEMDFKKRRVKRVPLQTLFENSISNTKPPLSEVKKSESENRLRADKGTVKRLERVPFQTLVENTVNIITSPDSKTTSPYNSSGCLKSGQPSSENSLRHHMEIASSKRRVKRIPFQSLLDNSLKENSPCGNPDNCTIDSVIRSMEQAIRTAYGRNKRWNIVADISCFLNEESRKSLQLLEGIRGTHLIIPRMVIRELDCLKRRESLFQRGTKASSILQWVEKCMVSTSWWIHVESTGEITPVAATPPASPSIKLNERSNDEFNHVSNAVTFSKYTSLAEIVSPTAEDHILDCALLFKRIKHDEQLMLLTDSVSLKIKAMAEGLLCETATEFRESLVSPFSERFLWEESCPRGATWSCSDEVKLIENHYQHCPTIRKSVKAAEGAKGLKLILLHNSHYGQVNQARC